MQKAKILAELIARLEREWEAARAAAQAAHAAATDEESKPENQYDTRALEASYLAQAQAGRTEELALALRQLRELSAVGFSPTGDIVRAGSLVRAESESGAAWYFVLPAGAGQQVEADGEKISVVTAASPLGRELLGKAAGDLVRVRVAGGTRELEITELR